MNNNIDIIDEKKRKREEEINTPLDNKGKKRIHSIISGQKGVENKIKNKVGRTLGKTLNVMDKIYKRIK